MSLHGFEIAATLVVVEVERIAVFDGGVALNADVGAEVFAIACAIAFGDEEGFRVLVVGGKGFPCRGHRFTMAAPGRKELDEDSAVAGLGGEIVFVEGGDCENEEETKDGCLEERAHFGGMRLGISIASVSNLEFESIGI